MFGLKKLNAYTKKQPLTLLSVALVLLGLLVVSNVLVFLGLVKRENVLRKVRKYLMVMRQGGIQFSEDLAQELSLDDTAEEARALKEEAEKVKQQLVEGMEVEEEEPVEEVEEEEPVEEEVEEVESFNAEQPLQYSAF